MRKHVPLALVAHNIVPCFSASFYILRSRSAESGLETGILFVFCIAIFPGIGEELLFRGYVQKRLLQRWSPAWAIGVTSAIFAVVHIQPHTVVAAFPLGIWLGFLAWKCGSIGPSILCHAFINGLINAWRVVVKFGDVPEGVQTVVEGFCVLVGLVCSVLLLRQVSRVEKKSADTLGEAAVAAGAGQG